MHIYHIYFIRFHVWILVRSFKLLLTLCLPSWIMYASLYSADRNEIDSFVFYLLGGNLVL